MAALPDTEMYVTSLLALFRACCSLTLSPARRSRYEPSMPRTRRTGKGATRSTIESSASHRQRSQVEALTAKRERRLRGWIEWIELFCADTCMPIRCCAPSLPLRTAFTSVSPFLLQAQTETERADQVGDETEHAANELPNSA